MAGRLCVMVAVVLATAVLAAGKEPLHPQLITAQALDALASQYRDAGLPMPPPDSPPMLLPLEKVNNQPAYVIGFKAASNAENNTPGKVLIGTQTNDANTIDSQLRPRPIHPVKGLSAEESLMERWADSSQVFPVNNWLALAAQCRLRGYNRLAAQIFERGLARDRSTGKRFTPIGDGTPRDVLAATAWNHWMNILCAEGTDRHEILTHLEKLSAEFPALDGPFQRDYLASLRAALIPSMATPGSVESSIDALVDHRERREMYGSDASDFHYSRLQGLGFAAVPALIAHLDDRRLTRAVATHDDDRLYYPRRVNEVVSDLIEDIAGPEEFPRGTAARAQGQPTDKAAVERWWARASAMGEETFMTSFLFPPNEVSLQIVTERYPRHLGEMYERMLQEQPELECQAIVAAIGGSGQIGREEKRRLLHEGVASPNVARSFEAIAVLSEVDQADADAALIDKLDHWPADVAGPYESGLPEAYIGNFMMRTNSAGVWQAFERALFRASTAFRLEMLKWLANGGLRSLPQDVRMLALLELFLDDEEVRVIGEKDLAPGGRFEGYPLDADTRRISVRNFVAGLLGTLLDMKPPPGAEHNERWWAKYRANARAAIDQQARVGAEAPNADGL